jgi:hypothetical protein
MAETTKLYASQWLKKYPKCLRTKGNKEKPRITQQRDKIINKKIRRRVK